MNDGEEKVPGIMVVDDDMDQRALVRIVARSQGLFVSIKEGGLSALRFLHDLNYDLDAIIIDLSMPDMDGITLTRQIRQNENLRSKANPIKVFWFTAWPFNPQDSNDPIVLGAKDLNVSKIYAKGCDLEQIVFEVKELVGMSGDEKSGEIAQYKGE